MWAYDMSEGPVPDAQPWARVRPRRPWRACCSTRVRPRSTTLLDRFERGKGLSWLDQYTKAIDSLTAQDIDGALKRHLNPESVVLVEASSFAAKWSSDLRNQRPTKLSAG
jgi:hypothetical protein